MTDAALYLLKANLLLILVFITYYFVFSKLTFYKMNRHFLLIGLLLSVVLPLSKTPGLYIVDDGATQAAVSPVNTSSHSSGTHPQPEMLPKVIDPQVYSGPAPLKIDGASVAFFSKLDYMQIITAVIYLGIAVMISKLSIQFLSLYQIYKRSMPAQLGGISCRLLQDAINPFSFWKSIFIHPHRHTEDELFGILEHEKIHTTQLHTIDVLLAEFILVLFWYNPTVWLIRTCIKENLEFITDQQMIDNGVDIKKYQYSLLSAINVKKQPAIVNNFNFLTLKKRIAMMNQPKTNQKQMMRYALVLPLLIAAPFAVSISKAQTSQINSTSAKSTVPVTNVQSSQNASIDRPAKKVQLQNTRTLKQGGTAAADLQTMEAPAQDSTVIKLQSSRYSLHTNYSPDRPFTALPDTLTGTPMVVIDGKESTMEQFNALPSNMIAAVTVVKGATTVPDRKEKLKDGLIIVFTKKSASADATEANINNNTSEGGNRQVFKTINRNADIYDSIQRNNNAYFTTKTQSGKIDNVAKGSDKKQ